MTPQLNLTPELQAEADAIEDRKQRERKEAAAAKAAIEHRDRLGQWFTPRPLAHKMVRSALRFAESLQLMSERAEYPLRVLDACAGEGAFTLELLAHDHVHVTAVEIDPVLSRTLKAITYTDGKRGSIGPHPLEVHTADFREWTKGCAVAEFDLMITNPPFHILRDVVAAGCSIARSVVVLGPTSMQHGEKHEIVHDRLLPKHLRVLKHRPKFSGSSMQPRSDHVVLYGVPRTTTAPRSRQSITYGVWRERWNPLKTPEKRKP